MKLSKLRLCLKCIIFMSLSRDVSAGLDDFTPLEKVGDWTIERKVDSGTGKVFCRASVPINGTWFSARPRLDKNDQLQIPTHIQHLSFSEKQTLEKVRLVLKTCRSGLIYIPVDG